MAMRFDASSFSTFARQLRSASPELGRRMRSRMGAAGRAGAAKMRTKIPHPDSGAATAKNLSWSDSTASKGGAIVIKGLAYTFGVGQPSRPGRYKHPVFGNWSSSSRTIMDVTDWIAEGWAEIGTSLELALDEILDETLAELAEE